MNDQKEIEKLINRDKLINNFIYHAPTEEKKILHEHIRDECFSLACVINNLVDSREKSLALTKLEECMMWANACVARNQ